MGEERDKALGEGGWEEGGLIGGGYKVRDKDDRGNDWFCCDGDWCRCSGGCELINEFCCNVNCASTENALSRQNFCCQVWPKGKSREGGDRVEGEHFFHCKGQRNN